MPARCHHTEFRRKAPSLILSRPTPRGFAGTRRGEPFLWTGHVPGAKKTGGAEAPPLFPQQWESYCFCSILAHESLSVTVRLKTGAPGLLSGSTQK